MKTLALRWLLLFALLNAPYLAATNIDELRIKADRGDAMEQCDLGWAYAHGDGVPKDPAEAVKWYRKSAGQGNAVA